LIVNLDDKENIYTQFCRNTIDETLGSEKIFEKLDKYEFAIFRDKINSFQKDVQDYVKSNISKITLL